MLLVLLPTPGMPDNDTNTTFLKSQGRNPLSKKKEKKMKLNRGV
jgi:hypothetical protein